MWCHDDAASDDDESLTVADLAHPYWQKRAGPTFWCHVDARHPNVVKLLTNPCWLHPAVSVALRDEKRLISDRMKHLLYEVFSCSLVLLLTCKRNGAHLVLFGRCSLIMLRFVVV